MDERERRPETEGIVIPPRPPLPPRPPEPPTSEPAPPEPRAAATGDDATIALERIEPPTPEPPAAATGDDATIPLERIELPAPEPTAAQPQPTAAQPQPTAAQPEPTTPAGHDTSAEHAPAAEPAAEPEATTLPLPIVGAPEAPAYEAAPPQTSPEQPKPHKARRRGRAVIWTLAVVVVLAVAGVVGWFAAEAWAEKTVTSTVQDQTAKALGLASSGDVQVTLVDPVLPQVIAGSLTTLDITAPNTPIGGATGTVTLHATGVPTRGDGVPTSATASVSLTPAALQSLAGSQSDIVPGSLHVVGSDVAVTLNPAQFLSRVSFTLTLTPSVANGQLVLTPSGFQVAGFDVSAETIRKRFGSLAAGILAPRSICVASYFPKGMTLTGIQVSPEAVVTDFAVDPHIATDPALQAKGTCG
jgi:hypothetical protein